MNIDLKGQSAVVTGAGRGIGEVIARALLEEGASVLLAERDPALLDAALARARKAGFAPEGLVCDVSKKADAERMAKTALEKSGRIDILVNNAGVAPMGAVDGLDESVWDANLDVNLKGTFLCCQAVIPAMKRQRRGRILNASSFAAIIPSYGSSAYAASKAGVVSLTRVLAGELGPWNITVNAYAPGMVPTEMNKYADAPDAQKTRLLNTLSIRRWEDPRDVAGLVVFLASDRAAYITGALIDVSGGKFATQMPQVAYERAEQEAKPA